MFTSKRQFLRQAKIFKDFKVVQHETGKYFKIISSNFFETSAIIDAIIFKKNYLLCIQISLALLSKLEAIGM